MNIIGKGKLRKLKQDATKFRNETSLNNFGLHLTKAIVEAGQRLRGQVVKFKPEGYGFVKVGNKEYFLHISDLEGGRETKYPEKGEWIAFDVARGKNNKGMAVRARRL